MLEPDISPRIIWAHLMTQFEEHARQVIRFARALPGFRDLSRGDTKVLVQEATYPILLVQLSRDFNTDLNFFNFSPRERRQILVDFPLFTRVVDHLYDTGKFLSSKCLGDADAAFLCCIIFLHGGESEHNDVFHRI